MPVGRVYTVAGAQRAMRSLPKHLQAEVRKAATDIAQDIATQAAGQATSQGGLAADVARSVKARKDRFPVIVAGGTTRLPARSDGVRRSGDRQSIGDVIWGAEFGGGARPRTRQFRPHRGTTGYFIYPTVRNREEESLARWLDALQAGIEAI